MNTESMGLDLFHVAQIDRLDLPDAVAVKLAVALYGDEVIEFSRALPAEAATGSLRGRSRIIVRRGLNPFRMHFAIARMVARIELERAGASGDTAERALAAWIVCPTDAFLRTVVEFGAGLSLLAGEFVVTETCAALRLAETGVHDAIVVTPLGVYRPSPSLGWIGDDDARALATRRSCKALRRVKIADEPGRTALVRSRAA